MGNLSLAKGTILWNLFKMATLCNFFSPADEPEDRNCDSPREVRKPDAVRVLILKPKNKQTNQKSCTESNTSRYKNRSVTLFFSFFLHKCVCACVRVRVCAGRDWQAAEEARPQSDLPGWRSILYQQETERRMAEPLEDGGGKEKGI